MPYIHISGQSAWARRLGHFLFLQDDIIIMFRFYDMSLLRTPTRTPFSSVCVASAKKLAFCQANRPATSSLFSHTHAPGAGDTQSFWLSCAYKRWKWWWPKITLFCSKSHRWYIKMCTSKRTRCCALTVRPNLARRRQKQWVRSHWSFAYTYCLASKGSVRRKRRKRAA